MARADHGPGCGNDGRTPVRLSNFVMRALSELSPAAGMEAMQRINAEIVNPTFLLLFLGTRVIAVLTAIVPLKVGPGRSYVIAGTACYLAGVLGVTMLCNLPMNNRLARLAAGAATDYWPHYLTVRLRWNHARTISSISSAAPLTVGSYQQHFAMLA
jgi:uncharacterized membrane protein